MIIYFLSSVICLVNFTKIYNKNNPNIELGENEVKVKFKEKFRVNGKNIKKIYVDIDNNLIILGYLGEIVIKSAKKINISKTEPIYISGEKIDYIQIGNKTFKYSLDEIEWLELQDKSENEI